VKAVGSREELTWQLEALDVAAPTWLDALEGDQLFTHLRKSSHVYMPPHPELAETGRNPAQEIADMGGNPAQPWRDLERHLDLTMARGLEVLGAMD